jgi:hypothetical protein
MRRTAVGRIGYPFAFAYDHLLRRNGVENELDIALALVDDATFNKALAAMGIPEAEFRCLRARPAGRPPFFAFPKCLQSNFRPGQKTLV